MVRFVLVAAVIGLGCGRFGFTPAGDEYLDADPSFGDGPLEGTPTDVDGDGTDNGVDNCPMDPNDQHDEDLDGRGDACDKCPPVAETVEADPDGDGVSTPCDPAPGTAGDRILVFQGFGAGLPASWVRSGTWSASMDGVVVNAAAGVSRSFTLPILPDTTSQMSAAITSLAVNGGVGTYRGHGLSAYHAQGFGSGVSCTRFLPLGSSARVAGTIDLSDYSILDSNANAWAENVEVVVTDTRGSGGLTCSTPPSTVQTGAGTVGTPRASVFTESIDTRVDWVMFVDRS